MEEAPGRCPRLASAKEAHGKLNAVVSAIRCSSPLDASPFVRISDNIEITNAIK